MIWCMYCSFFTFIVLVVVAILLYYLCYLALHFSYCSWCCYFIYLLSLILLFLLLLLYQIKRVEPFLCDSFWIQPTNHRDNTLEPIISTKDKYVNEGNININYHSNKNALQKAFLQSFDSSLTFVFVILATMLLGDIAIKASELFHKYVNKYSYCNKLVRVLFVVATDRDNIFVRDVHIQGVFFILAYLTCP